MLLQVVLVRECMSSPLGHEKGFFKMILFPNSGSYRVLVVIQRTGEDQESPQVFSTAGTGQAWRGRTPRTQIVGLHIFSIGAAAREARGGSIKYFPLYNMNGPI